MFTLKLFRRAPDQGPISTLIMEAERVTSHEMTFDVGPKTIAGKAMALDVQRPGDPYPVQFFVGEIPQEIMSQPGCAVTVLGDQPNSLWGWGLLENTAGNTTQHFRPASYG